MKVPVALGLSATRTLRLTSERSCCLPASAPAPVSARQSCAVPWTCHRTVDRSSSHSHPRVRQTSFGHRKGSDERDARERSSKSSSSSRAASVVVHMSRSGDQHPHPRFKSGIRTHSARQHHQRRQTIGARRHKRDGRRKRRTEGKREQKGQREKRDRREGHTSLK